MPSKLSFLNLHLQCRLWIAELNGDINMLRIYHDYLQELSDKSDQQELKKDITRFEQIFPALRKEIDDLKNEMHLLKMKFAAYVRENKPYDKAVYKSTSYDSLEDRFAEFSKKFEKLRKELGKLEASYS
ncbi:MAG: hypothetical protein H0X41_01025 [Chitinophagaceae bacterium]|nr:hypothetical protein [Chitinophagaceae bacterium]